MKKGKELDYLPRERASSVNMVEKSLTCTHQKEVIVDNRFECEDSTHTDSNNRVTREFSLSICYFHPGRETRSGYRREEPNEQEKLALQCDKLRTAKCVNKQGPPAYIVLTTT